MVQWAARLTASCASGGGRANGLAKLRFRAGPQPHILIRRHSRWYQWPVAQAWSGKLIMAYTCTNAIQRCRRGIRGVVQGWRAGGLRRLHALRHGSIVCDTLAILVPYPFPAQPRLQQATGSHARFSDFLIGPYLVLCRCRALGSQAQHRADAVMASSSPGRSIRPSRSPCAMAKRTTIIRVRSVEDRQVGPLTCRRILPPGPCIVTTSRGVRLVLLAAAVSPVVTVGTKVGPRSLDSAHRIPGAGSAGTGTAPPTASA